MVSYLEKREQIADAITVLVYFPLMRVLYFATRLKIEPSLDLFAYLNTTKPLMHKFHLEEDNKTAEYWIDKSFKKENS